MKMGRTHKASEVGERQVCYLSTRICFLDGWKSFVLLFQVSLSVLQSCCFYFRVHEESIHCSGFSQMSKSFFTFFFFILLNWLFNLLGVSNESSARILDVIRSVKESNHKKMSKRMYI